MYHRICIVIIILLFCLGAVGYSFSINREIDETRLDSILCECDSFIKTDNYLMESIERDIILYDSIAESLNQENTNRHRVTRFVDLGYLPQFGGHIFKDTEYIKYLNKSEKFHSDKKFRKLYNNTVCEIFVNLRLKEKSLYINVYCCHTKYNKKRHGFECGYGFRCTFLHIYDYETGKWELKNIKGYEF